MQVCTKTDLPVMANTQDFLVYHFILDLECDFETKNFDGSILLFIDPIQKQCGTSGGRIFSIEDYKRHLKLISHTKKFTEITEINKSVDNSNECSNKIPELKELTRLILDSHKLKINSVEELCLSDEQENDLRNCRLKEFQHRKHIYDSLRSHSATRSLCFEVTEWCVKLTKENVFCVEDFPNVVRIRYTSLTEGSSLRWATDQDGMKCVYTSAMFANNRAFLPCQEYASLSTWQAYIKAPEGCTVIMSGEISERHKDVFYHECGVPMPAFTLAIAVGYWAHETIVSDIISSNPTESQSSKHVQTTCHHTEPCMSYSQTSLLPVTLYAPQSMIENAAQSLRSYMEKCVQSIQELLGPSPFGRIQFVMFPSCSQDMAMCNPNLIFVSQSLFAGDDSMFVQLSHEVSHYWFGLLIGAKDWTEEWLSEGFATFVEDIVHARAMQWRDEEARTREELRALLRYRTLEGEMGSTDQQIQSMRSNKGEPLVDSNGVMYIKNGMNPYKLFNQVHYLKGYFLLRYLSLKVGVEKFSTIFRKYIEKFHGHFVLSEDFLGLVLDTFPQLSNEGITLDTLYTEWMDCPGMPEPLCDFQVGETNPLYKQILVEVEKWKSINKHHQKSQQKKKRKLNDTVQIQPLVTDQLVLLMEFLLEEPKLCSATLENIRQQYNMEQRNAKVRHGWCELVVKHRYKVAYCDVKNFLLNDQAMGVYLYGELMISRCPKQRELAHQCFSITGSEMEQGTYKTVHTMLFGDAPS